MAAADYSRTFQCAEEVASYVMDSILTGGGTILWQKYLERKAFVFAQESMSNAATAHLGMCFVAHDGGEEAMTESWDIEVEPMPREIDSWASMFLPLKRRSPEEQAEASRDAARRHQRRMNNRRAANGRPKAETKNYRSENRMFPLPEEGTHDEEEERLRTEKTQEKYRALERENMAKQAEEKDRAKESALQALHEEMDRRAYTFDSEGKLLWIEEPKPERLPRVQETFMYALKKEQRRMMDSGTMGGTVSSGGFAGQTKEGKGKLGKKEKRLRDKKGKYKDEEIPDFTDGFDALQDGQPPILETMVVRPGVVLEAQGQKQVGPELDTGKGRPQMSRKEYIAATEQDMGLASADGGAGGPGGLPGGPGAAKGGGETPNGSASGGADNTLLGGEGGSGDRLPPLPSGRGSAATAGPGRQAPGGGNRLDGMGAGVPAGDQGAMGRKVQQSPSVPNLAVRGKRNAIGNLPRPPRYHQPLLGGPFVSTGTAQPPIGATMGHGLAHGGAVKESFFFPPTSPEPPTPLLRAASEGVIRRERGPRSEDGSPRGGAGEKAGGKDGKKPPSRGASPRMVQHGVIKGDSKSLAYKNLLNALGGP